MPVVYIDVFASRAHHDARCGLWVAQLHLRITDDSDSPTIEIDDKALNALTEPSTTRHGRTTEQRKALYMGYWQCEHDAREFIAETSPPLPDLLSPRYQKAIEERDRHYQSKLDGLHRAWQEKHGLGDEQISSLFMEGLEKKWVQPPLDERFLW